jgi:allantoinase
MPAIDLLIRGGTVVLPSGEKKISLAVDQGKVIGHGDTEARQVIEAKDLLILPGALDPHVHFNGPGREDWEGWETGSRASRAGGATSVVEMPLNALPPTLDVETFQKKKAVADKKSCVDFALWGGITPLNLDQLEKLGRAGVIGFKAFMINSGTPDFPGSDPATLKKGMSVAAKLGLTVSVHAESPELIRRRTEEIRKKGGTSVRDYLASRPIETELEAIRLACDLAGETRCRLYIVHVSCPEGIEEIQKARQRGVDVTAETCPHYLVLTDEDMVRLGPPAKCAPPLRSAATQKGLLQKIREGKVETIGSDHSPAPGSMKTDPDFFKVWGGISGCQHLLPLLFSAGLTPLEIAKLTSENPARRLRLHPRKGSLEVGADADFVLIRRQTTSVKESDLHYRHKISPFIGMNLPVRIEDTYLRGQKSGRGRFLSPLLSS